MNSQRVTTGIRLMNFSLSASSGPAAHTGPAGATNDSMFREVRRGAARGVDWEVLVTTIVFDTHAFVKELAAAGMPEPQAEVLARAQARLIDEQLATKRDLKELELRLKHDLTLRLGSMMVVSVGVVAALVKLL